MADFNKPSGTDLWSTILGQIRSARESVAKMFEGGAGDTNLPTGAKRMDSDGTTYRWNGSSWDAIGGGSATVETLTNKTIDVDNNTVSNIETDNFKSGVIVTTVGATGSDTAIPSEQAVREAIDAGSVSGLKAIYCANTATGDGSGSDANNRVAASGVGALFPTTTEGFIYINASNTGGLAISLPASCDGYNILIDMISGAGFISGTAISNCTITCKGTVEFGSASVSSSVITGLSFNSCSTSTFTHCDLKLKSCIPASAQTLTFNGCKVNIDSAVLGFSNATLTFNFCRVSSTGSISIGTINLNKRSHLMYTGSPTATINTDGTSTSESY